MRKCEKCGGRLDALTRSDARFCSTRCRVAAHRASKLPAELTSRHRWVRWRPVKRGERWTKMPVQVDGRPASSTSPVTWARHAAVVRSGADGRLGFVLGDGVGAIDLDHCLTGSNVAPWAQKILDRLPPTYIEVSPSGDGLHVWGLLPEGPGRVVRDGRNVEVYSVGRFLTVTSKRWGGSPSRLADLSEAVASL